MHIHTHMHAYMYVLAAKQAHIRACVYAIAYAVRQHPVLQYMCSDLHICNSIHAKTKSITQYYMI